VQDNYYSHNDELIGSRVPKSSTYMTLNDLGVQQMRCSARCTISERAEKDVRSWRAVYLWQLSFLLKFAVDRTIASSFECWRIALSI